MKIKKREGMLVDFNGVKIQRAIEKSMSETIKGIDSKLSQAMAKKIEDQLAEDLSVIYSVEQIQDLVEDLLMGSTRKDVAKKYIIYREARRIKSNLDSASSGLLSNSFLSSYKHAMSPMGQQGSFVYYRTYSRWLPDEKRREYWWETVKRAVEYNTSLVPTTRDEAERLFDNIFNLKQFLSGRTFWIGSTDVATKHPMSNFNCAFEIIDSLDDFTELFYLLMIGSGVGIRVLKEDVEKLAAIRANVELIHEDYAPVLASDREDITSVSFKRDTAYVTVGDSKEGWVQALGHYLKILYSYEFATVGKIVINYNNVRPKGEKLKTFGGTASGHESLKNMFSKIDRLFKKRGLVEGEIKIRLRPIDCLDIANIIGENVVVGGVRRTAEIVLIDPDDKECVEAKSSLYKKVEGQWIVDEDLVHRQMSNNSIYYQEKPTRDQLHWQIEQMRYSGEPGWVNGEAGNKRRSNMQGVNPCAEILLDDKGLCNLTTVNVFAFVDGEGNIDIEGLLEAQRLSARAGYRMTIPELEMKSWDNTQKRDKLVGCSLTGWQDLVNKASLTKKQQVDLLRKLRKAAHEAVREYALALGDKAPLLVTTVKPEGTLSQLPGVSSGLHFSHSPYYVRRIRINAHDSLVKVAEELGWPVLPEVGQDLATCTTKVIEFPVKAPEGKTKLDVSAIEQLEIYKMFMEHYVDHNASITVHVRNNEWDQVEEWVWKNWDDVVAVSFLSLDDNFYELLPYEGITKKEYEKRVREMNDFVPSLISKYEIEHIERTDLGQSSCDQGLCPIR